MILLYNIVFLCVYVSIILSYLSVLTLHFMFPFFVLALALD